MSHVLQREFAVFVAAHEIGFRPPKIIGPLMAADTTADTTTFSGRKESRKPWQNARFCSVPFRRNIEIESRPDPVPPPVVSDTMPESNCPYVFRFRSVQFSVKWIRGGGEGNRSQYLGGYSRPNLETPVMFRRRVHILL